MSRARNIFGRLLAIAGAAVFGWGTMALVITGRPTYWLSVLVGISTVYITREVWSYPLFQRTRLETVLNVQAFAIAADAFGLTGPISLVLEQWIPGGAYYQRKNGVHIIGVDEHLTPREMSQAIYHELYHAHVCERDFNGDGRRYHAETYLEAIDAMLGGFRSLQEERAATTELLHYDLPLTKHEVITR